MRAHASTAPTHVFHNPLTSMQLPKWQNLPLNCSTSPRTSCPECTNFSHSASSCGLKHSILQHFFFMVRIELPAVQKSHSESSPCQVDTWKIQIPSKCENLEISRSFSHHLFIHVIPPVCATSFSMRHWYLHRAGLPSTSSGGPQRPLSHHRGGRWKNLFTKQRDIAKGERQA